MPLVTGATAAGLRIVRLLGSGQIGELYLAEHPRLPRHLALKLVADDLSADPEYRHRFNKESGLAAALWHPHIVGICDRGELEGRLWLSMDYVDGVDAARLLSETYPSGMPPDMVVEIVTAIADALDYAHDQGLLHRYVNPSNILIANSASDRRRILLAGFGIARRADDVNSLTRADVAIGTASYTAPEQLKDEEPDGRADQYALACTAFHLLTGSPPYAHFNPAVVISKHLNESPPRPGDVRPELTRFGGTFARALAKEPTDRFRRCQDFARALERGEGNKFDVVNAGGTAVAAASDGNGEAPTRPAMPAEADGIDDVIASPEGWRDTATQDTTAPPERVVTGAASDDASMTSRHRRLLHTAALVLPIAVVAVAGIAIVTYLRSASESQDNPTIVEPTSSVTPTAPAPQLPARATPPPALTAPPPPTVKAPASTPPPPATTTTATTSVRPPETTAAPTAKASTTTSSTSTSSTPAGAGLDTRPAVGMPCGPEQTGAPAVGNTGGPLNCVQTPGGFAWEPPGG